MRNRSEEASSILLQTLMETMSDVYEANRDEMSVRALEDMIYDGLMEMGYSVNVATTVARSASDLLIEVSAAEASEMLAVKQK